MPIDPRPALAKRRLTDFFEGAGEDGRRETLSALFRGRRLVVALLWLLCQSVIALFLLAGAEHGSLLDRLVGPVAVSLILGTSCLGVLVRDLMAARLMEGPGLDRAWRRARDRSVSRLAIFCVSLVVGGAMAVLWSSSLLSTHPCLLR